MPSEDGDETCVRRSLGATVGVRRPSDGRSGVDAYESDCTERGECGCSCGCGSGFG